MTFDELHRVIMQGENARVEFKAEVSAEVMRRLSTDIAALANSQGGIIIFGVTNQQDPAGCVIRGNETERISQQASNCRPAIRIDFEEVLFGKRHFLAVRVPRSTIVHSDQERRFPVRIGNTTDYLDAPGLVTLLYERGLLKREEAEEVRTQGGRERKPLPENEATILARSLKNEKATVRSEAIRDLSGIINRFVVLDREPISNAIENILQSGADEEIRIVLDVVRSVVLWGTEAEKRVVSPWLEYVAEIGRGSYSPQTISAAYDVLECAGSEAAVDLLVHLVTKADDERFANISPTNVMGNIKFHGLYVPTLEAMYGLLEQDLPDNVRKRVSAVLEAVRRSYG